jgi:hypothetical protein
LTEGDATPALTRIERVEGRVKNQTKTINRSLAEVDATPALMRIKRGEDRVKNTQKSNRKNTHPPRAEAD